MHLRSKAALMNSSQLSTNISHDYIKTRNLVSFIAKSRIALHRNSELVSINYLTPTDPNQGLERIEKMQRP